MKITLIALVLLSNIVNAGDICSKSESSIEPSHQWEESAFTKDAALASLKALSAAVEKGEDIGTYHLPNSITLLEGYILKRDALKAMRSKNTPKGIKEFYKSGFCEFLSGAVIYD
ncbi:hypothetical protein ACU6U9_05045 [Pseudomonas sp. HK3]|jgi:hypothetical protein